MLKNNKSFAGDLISTIIYRALNMLGRNLPRHVSQSMLTRVGSHFLLDKTLNLQTNRLQKVSTLYQKAMMQVDQVDADNFSKRIRHTILYQLVKNTLSQSNDGINFAECGCWKGQSAYMTASLIKESGAKNCQFHIFDSFEGLSEYSKEDLAECNQNQDVNETRKSFAGGLELVKNNLRDFSFISYHPGWIPDKFHEVDEKKFSFVNIDVDLYDPIRDSIEFFYPRMEKGGIVFLDDYAFNQFPGASKAIDEFVEKESIKTFVALPTGGAFLTKC